MGSKGEITLLLSALRGGQEGARGDLLAVVYDELRQIAGSLLRRERPGHTMNPTDVVHEAYFRLFDTERCSFEERRHFFGCAARAMRQVLVDHARQKLAGKRIPQDAKVALDEATAAMDLDSTEMVSLDRALEELEALDPRQCQVVELRYFGGRTEAEVAELLGLSRATVTREWRAARVWLHDRMR